MALDETAERLSLELRDELASNDRKLAVDPCKVPVRFSRLRQMARSALHYYWACQESDQDTLARKLGRVAHALVLGKPVVLWPGTTKSGASRPRSGKEWDAFKAQHAGAEIANEKEMAQGKAIADAIRRHPRAAEMIFEGDSQLEHEIDWNYLGRPCQSHLDVYRRGRFVADLKCARDASPDRFKYVAEFNHYHSQLAYYTEAAEAIGDPTPDAYIIAVESAPPYAIAVYQLEPELLEQGRRQCRLWFEQLLSCERSAAWPGYAADVIKLAPRAASDPFALVIDGEEQHFA